MNGVICGGVVEHEVNDRCMPPSNPRLTIGIAGIRNAEEDHHE